MRQPLAAAIAWRYLVTKKAHGAVATISTVSVCAMAVATAAIICVLSVFNGFRREIGVRLDNLQPDVEITPAKGKVMEKAAEIVNTIGKIKGVELATATLSDNALVIYNGQEMPITLKGVNAEEFARVTSIKSLIPEEYGQYIDSTGRMAVISVGVATRLQAYPGSDMLVFAPKRKGRVNLANPAASFMTDSAQVTGIYFAQQSQYDEDGVVLPIEKVRKLLQYDDQASAIEVKGSPGTDGAALASAIQALLGNGYVVKDRLRQQEMNFRMINIEKWVSFLLLGFILLIASFNLLSSLSMLVIEKERSIATLSHMGMSKRRIGAVFAWESIYVSAAGGAGGIIIGLALCLIQQHFELIKLGGNPSATIVSAYPVQVEALDILITLAPVAAIAIITAAITAAFARARIAKN